MPEVGVSRCVLVNQPTEDVAATQPAEVRRSPCSGVPEAPAAQGPNCDAGGLVVMLDLALPLA